MALHMLTGFPEMDYLHSNMKQLKENKGGNLDALWNHMLVADQRNYTIAAGTSGAGEEDIDGSGIVSGHAYTMIAAYEVVDRKGKSEKLVQLRNPWGQTEFKGAWNDQDDEHWTPALKKKLNVQDKDDGIFFMPLLDYIKYFDHTCICMDVPE